MTKNLLIIGLMIGAFLFTLVFMPCVSFAAMMEKEVVAEGIAAGGSLQSRDAALNRALRNAVEQSVGVLIDSETMVSNFQVLDDKIYSGAKGYVKSYEIISDNEGSADVYKIKIKAKVALGALSKDIEGMGLIREKLANPRIVVLINDYVDGIEQPTGIAAMELEKIFMQNKFPVVSKEQMEKIKEKDTTLAFGNPEKAAALGRRYGAEVAIVGQATSNLVDTSEPYGVSVFAYEARIEARAVKTDTAQVLSANVVTATERAGGRVPAANKALSAAAEELSTALMQKLAEAWRSNIYNETTIEIIAENADTEKATSLARILKLNRNVKGVSERSLVNNVLELDVRFFGTADQMVALLRELDEPVVDIINKTPNRIDIKFVD